jgi:DNA-binding NtrC family response regulator
VRELRWTLERALVQSSGDEIDTPHLPPQMLPPRP